MKSKDLVALVLAPALLLVACSSENQDAEPKAADKQRFKEVNALLEQGKGIEMQMHNAAEAQQQKIDRETSQ